MVSSRAIAAAIHQHRLDVAAWFLRDAVETTLYYAIRTPVRAPEFSASEIKRIHRATEWAAMAIAARKVAGPVRVRRVDRAVRAHRAFSVSSLL